MTTRLMAICLITFGLLSACQSSPPEDQTTSAVPGNDPAILTPTSTTTFTQTAASTPTLPPTKPISTGINWNEATSWAGEFKVVCGPVVDTAYASGSSGKPTFLNIGRSHPDPERFTIVIWDDNRANFPMHPENFYLGKDICVDGLIELYKGGAQIEGKTQAQIDVQ